MSCMLIIIAKDLAVKLKFYRNSLLINETKIYYFMPCIVQN